MKGLMALRLVGTFAGRQVIIVTWMWRGLPVLSVCYEMEVW